MEVDWFGLELWVGWSGLFLMGGQTNTINNSMLEEGNGLSIQNVIY